MSEHLVLLDKQRRFSDKVRRVRKTGFWQKSACSARMSLCPFSRMESSGKSGFYFGLSRLWFGNNSSSINVEKSILLFCRWWHRTP